MCPGPVGRGRLPGPGKATGRIGCPVQRKIKGLGAKGRPLEAVGWFLMGFGKGPLIAENRL